MYSHISLCLSSFPFHYVLQLFIITYYILKPLAFQFSLIDQCTLISLLGLPINRRQGEVVGIDQSHTREWLTFSDAVKAVWRLYLMCQNADSGVYLRKLQYGHFL